MKRVAVLLAALALVGCGQKLSNDEMELFDAVMFALYGIEENSSDADSSRPRVRRVQGRTIEYFSIGNNGIGTSHEETNEKIKNSLFVRRVEKISSPEKCVFYHESLTEFSKGDSKDDFSAHVMRGGEKINLMNAHQFKLYYNMDTDVANVNIQGPSVVCSDDNCGNAWNKMIYSSGRGYQRETPISIQRREKAIALIKKVCPGKPY